MPNLSLMGAHLLWLDRLLSGMRVAAQIGDMVIVYLLTGSTWYAVTEAMTHQQSVHFEQYAIEPLPVGPGLGAWLDQQTAQLMDDAGLNR